MPQIKLSADEIVMTSNEGGRKEDGAVFLGKDVPEDDLAEDDPCVAPRILSVDVLVNGQILKIVEGLKNQKIGISKD